MNIKFIILGGIAFFVFANVLGAITGQVIHGPGGFLSELYRANAAMWRPELNQVPPDMGALLPLWMTTGCINSLLIAAVYNLFAGAMTSTPVANGLRFGIGASLIMAGIYMSYFGIFNLPATIWMTWAAEGLVTYTLGGIILAFIAGKLLKPAA